MTTIAKDRELPTPAISPENAPFFEGTAKGVLMLKHCEACGRHHYYPRALCPHCFSDRTRWMQAQGKGTIYTVTVQRAGTPTPFALAYVQLAEGPRMLTNIVDCDLDTLQVGMPVTLVCKPAKDGTTMIPMFTPTA